MDREGGGWPALVAPRLANRLPELGTGKLDIQPNTEYGHKMERRRLFPWVAAQAIALAALLAAASLAEALEVLVAGGFFTAAGGDSASSLAYWDGVAWHPLGTGVSLSGSAGAVRALHVHNSELIVGGTFDFVGSVNATNVAAYDGSSWRALGELGNPSSSMNTDTIYTFATFNNALFAGGSFEMPLGPEYFARWDGTKWLSIASFWPALGSEKPAINAMCVYNNALILGGSFSEAGSVLAQNIVAYGSGSSWEALAGGVDGMVNSLTVYSNQLIVGGYFSSVNGGMAANNIAQWSGTSWSTLGEGLTGFLHYTNVWVLTVYNNELIAGGYFSTADKYVAARNIARWDGFSWRSVGGGVAGSTSSANVVTAMRDYQGSLVAAGFIYEAGDFPANFSAQWTSSTGWKTLGLGTDGPKITLALFNLEGVTPSPTSTANPAPTDPPSAEDMAEMGPLTLALLIVVVVLVSACVIAGLFFTYLHCRKRDVAADVSSLKASQPQEYQPLSAEAYTYGAASSGGAPAYSFTAQPSD